MKLISLTRGYFTKVDDEDYERLNEHKWHYKSDYKTIDGGYAVRTVVIRGKKICITMHRLLIESEKNMEIDHIDGNRLNNQKYNLRVVSRSDNMKNKKIYKNNTSGYKGVSWHKYMQVWVARIGVSGKKVQLGCFRDPLEAARVYNNAAIKYFGEYARLNII